MKIRKIKLSDLNSCSRLLRVAYSEAPYNEKFKNGAALRYIKSKYEHGKDSSFVLVDNEEIIGFVFLSMSYWSEGPQAVMEEIVIDEKKQGMGYGKKLVQFVDDYLRKKKVKSVMLWVNKNANAFHFHQKNGYFAGDEYSVMFKNF